MTTTTRPPGRRAAALLAAVFLPACGGMWHRTDPEVPNTKVARQQVQIWVGDSALRWHAVRVTHDSISGIPFLQPIDCDSCRIALSRTAVDSVRLGDPVSGFWVSILAVVVLPMLVILQLTDAGGT